MATLFAFGLLLTLPAGCATVEGAEYAVVCPQCETVWLDDTLYDRNDRDLNLTRALAHDCPGCQGIISSWMTWLKDGGLKHACSICEDKPFRCRAGSS